MSIYTLPNELLSQCCSYVDKDTIKHLRLVSKRFHDSSSSFLITSSEVAITAESFNHLSHLAKHPIFSKSIQTVQLNVSYYDRILAENLQRFAEHNTTELYQSLEMMERGLQGDMQEAVSKQWGLLDEWDKIGVTVLNDSQANGNQKIILKAHEEYKRRFQDQEIFMQPGDLVGRRKWVECFVSCLERFPALRKIIIGDRRRYPFYENWSAPGDRFSEKAHINRCVATSCWKGSFRTAADTSPPAHMIPDLFIALAATSIRPQSFDIGITTPFNLRCMQMTHTQLDAVRTTLNKAEYLFFGMQRWARKESFAEDNDRPHEELGPLGNLTTAFFSSTKLKEMHLSLDDYPCFYEFPTISFVDLLPLHLPSPDIHKIYFRGVPFKLDELRIFMGSLKEKLEWFNCSSPYLLNGKWMEALGEIKNLKKLKHFELRHLKGGEYGNRGGWIRNKPSEEDIVAFVMEKGEMKNPLDGWVPDND